MESNYSGGFFISDLVIPGRNNHSPGGFLVHEVVIPWQKTHLSRVGRVLANRIPNVLRVVTIPGFITRKDLYREAYFLNFKHENVIKMKNKPDPTYFNLQIYPMNSKKGIKIS
jgi:hypothetical protein